MQTCCVRRWRTAALTSNTCGKCRDQLALQSSSCSPQVLQSRAFQHSVCTTPVACPSDKNAPAESSGGLAAGENSIVIVGGANTEDWEFSEAANEARAAKPHM